MALDGGSVSVNPDLSETGSGLALQLYLAWKAHAVFNLFGDFPATAQRKAMLDGFALKANLEAPVIVAYFRDNAEITVKVAAGDSGLQRMPATTTEDTDTKGPSGLKTLVTKGTLE